MSTKKTFRQQMKAKLANIPKEVIEQESLVIFKKITCHPQYQTASKISCFLNMEGEVRTAEIVKHLFLNGKRCFVPLCEPNEMHMVEIKDLQDLHTLPKNSWGIPEPSMDEKRMDSFMAGGLDLIIMPGLAFDRKGNRIGYGKGYYDRFLSKCYINSEQYAITRPFTIAIALQCQLVEEVPTEVTDLKPDEIICA